MCWHIYDRSFLLNIVLMCIFLGLTFWVKIMGGKLGCYCHKNIETKDCNDNHNDIPIKILNNDIYGLESVQLTSESVSDDNIDVDKILKNGYNCNIKEMIVIGFIRLFRRYDFHVPLSNIIFDYYGAWESEISWISRNMRLKSNNIIDNKYSKSNNIKYDSIFLKHNIYSGIYIYKFRIINIVYKDRDIWFGLYKIKHTKSCSNKYTFNRDDPPSSYNWICNFDGCGVLETSCNPSKPHKQYGCLIKNNDIIEMIIDLNSMKLSYSVNGFNYGVAFNITKSIYKVGIVIRNDINPQAILYRYLNE